MSTEPAGDSSPVESIDEGTVRMVYRAVQAFAGREGARVTLPDLAYAARLEDSEVEAAMGRMERADPVAFQRVGGDPLAWEVSL